MTKERNCVELRGVTADLNRSLKLLEPQYPTEIKRVGQILANRLGRLTETVKSKGVFGGFVFWNFEEPEYFEREDKKRKELFGLSLKCDDFYADEIIFFNDNEHNKNCYILSIIGGINYNDELWNGFGTELQIVFKQSGKKLKFSEVLFVGQADHHFDTYSFDISEKTKLKIVSIADRATNIFMRMNLLTEKP